MNRIRSSNPGPPRSDPSARTAGDGRHASRPLRPRSEGYLALPVWLVVTGLGLVAATSVLATSWWHDRDAPAAATPQDPLPAAPAVAAVAAQAADPGPWQLIDPEPMFVEGQVTQLRALVRRPAQLQPGRHPLAVLIHGTHGLFRHGSGADSCPEPGGSPPQGATQVQSAQGLAWLATLLSERGMVAVVLDASAMTCVYGPPGANRRMELGLGLIKRWATWQATGQGPLPPDVVAAADLDRLVLVGHSSGADAVALLALQLVQRKTFEALDAHVAAVLMVAPADFVRVPHLPAPAGVVVAGCDGDVGRAMGERLHARLLERQGMPVLLWSIEGAVHNALNDAWRDEVQDGGIPVCPPSAKMGLTEQRELIGQLAGDWLSAMAAKAPAPAWVLGTAPPPQAAGGSAVRWRVQVRP